MDAANVHLDASADAIIKELTRSPSRFVHILSPRPRTWE